MVYLLLHKFGHKVDVILAGAPWDNIPNKEFKNISDERKFLSSSFYDIDDKLITYVLTKGFELLVPDGKIFITSSSKTIARIKHYV